MRSIRLAFRTLFKSPFVTTVAILSLALGIGANAAIFSLFDHILIRSLPVSEPDRLVNLVAPGPKPGSTSCNNAGGCEAVFSYRMFRDLEAAQTAFSGVAAHRLLDMNVAYNGITLSGDGVLVSGSYFPVLGVRPERGRLIAPVDDETIGAHPVAVLSHSVWEGRLGADPNIIGQTITVNGQSLTVIGIAPRGFEGTTLGSRPLVYVPITMRTALSPGFAGFDNRRDYWAYVFARMKPDATIEQASAAVNAIYGPIINDVEAPLQDGMSDATMTRFRARQITVEPGHRGQSSTHREARIPLMLMLGTAGMVLLIACANIANLLLARGANRSMEMAVRLSLGASRRQVLSQLLTESIVLAIMGGIAGVFAAWWTLKGMAALLPPDAAGTLPFALNLRVIAFCGVLAIATGLLFGLFPALHSTRSDLVTTIRSNAGNLTVTRGAARFRSSLVTAQIALSMALLITAGLFLRSLVNVNRVDLGIQVENVVSFAIFPALSGYEPERMKLLYERVEQELAAVPGVTHVTSGRVPLLANSNWGNDVNVQGFDRGPDTDANSRFNMVGPSYFAALGIPILSGREFTIADNDAGADVVIVNEAFARKFNLGTDAVGKRMSQGGDELDLEIIGLVKDAKYSEVKDEVPPQFFVPWRQLDRVPGLTFYVRTAVDTDQIMRAIQPLIARVDPNLPIENLKTLPTQVRENTFLERMIGTMSASFAILATLLAAIGLYGVLAYTVARRTREIGVRMALGADGSAVRMMVLRQVGAMLLIGGIVGVAAAIALGRAASSLLYGVTGNDPLIIAAAVGLLGAFALAAGYIPALRASQVDPLRALRYE